MITPRRRFELEEAAERIMASAAPSVEHRVNDMEEAGFLASELESCGETQVSEKHGIITVTLVRPH